MKRIIRIGTRGSRLARWQARQVEKALEENGYNTEVTVIKSEGDLNLSVPLYEMDIQGVFTRFLDAALLNNKIDVAVHSMKDVPTTLARGLCQAAVLKRGTAYDLLVCKSTASFLSEPSSHPIIATGSLRRKAQWLNRYSNSIITGLRGNVNTRLQKLHESNWDGALFAAAGLERIQLRPENAIPLHWMIPAPAQGAILVVCRSEDAYSREASSLLNDVNTAICTAIERDFLKTLTGGCATPISAHARIKEGNLWFEGNLLTPDGKEKISVRKQAMPDKAHDLGIAAGEEILARGGAKILDQLNTGEEGRKRS